MIIALVGPGPDTRDGGMGPNMKTIDFTDLEKGLASEEARRRLAQFGPNRFASSAPYARLKAILKILADPMAIMLLAAALLYFLLGVKRDGFILLAAVFPVLFVDVSLEFRSREALKKLAQAVAPQALVLRDKVEISVLTDELVPGDILVLHEGNGVHADGVVRRCANFSLDESQLTGESEPVSKKPPESELAETWNESHLFYAGSTVLTGQAYGEILLTGRETRYGKIAELVDVESEEQAPIQKKIGAIVRRLVLIAGAVILLVFALTFWRGSSVSSSILAAISLGISVIPEEFPLVLTVFLSLGAWRLGKKGVLIKRLSSVETLGSTTIICVDKTGTLTQGRFTLSADLPVPGNFSEEDVMTASILACELSPVDPMEKAILEFAREKGIQPTQVQKSWRLAHDFDFDPRGKHMSHVWEPTKGGEWRIVAKGALEGILEHCEVSPKEREWVERENARLAGQGNRVLAVAGREASAFTGNRLEDERGLRLYGLLSFQDPLRPEVAAAVAQCQEAGIKIKLITGDHLLTAHAVADAAGIDHQPSGLMNGPELEKLKPGLFTEKVSKGSIFARVKPEQKYAIVDALEKSGEVVAMTGDGINDAPALKRAHIGIAMGRKGTEVAKAAAGMILLEDSFSAIVATIGEGRRIFANIQKSFSYLISFKLPSVGIALVCPLLGVPLLLLPVHLVWLELIQHPVSALVFEEEPLENNEMKRPPRDPSAPLLKSGQVLRAAFSGLFLMTAVLWVYLGHLSGGVVHARSLAFSVYILGSLIHIWDARAMDRPWWKVPFPRTKRFWLVCGSAALTLPVLFQTPWLAAVFQVEPLAFSDWGLALVSALAATVWRAVGWPIQKKNDGDPRHKGESIPGV